MTINVAFPDYDTTTLPVIPAGFVDFSWRTDACPRFENEELKLTLWVDYLNPDDREFPDTNRFLLAGEDGEYIVASDDFADVLAAIEERRA